MPAGADKENDLAARRIKDRRDDGDIRQMCAAIIGVVQRHHITGFECRTARADHGANTFAHGAQMHRHMRRIGDQRASSIKNGAGEIKPFLDIY